MKKRRIWIAVLLAIAFGLVLICITPFLLTLAGYNVGFPVDTTGQTVKEDTQLQPGDQVIAEWGGDWWKAEVLEVRSDGKVKIRYTTWDSQWDEVLDRERLKLPPENQNP